MKEKIRFGIIGCSNIANSSTIPAIISSEFSELTHIGSRNSEKAKEFATRFNCKNFGSYNEVLNDEQVDAVYISLPVGLHEEWTVKAAEAGKHILCEKTSTTSYDSAVKMIDSSKQNKVRLMEGFMFRFHPSHAKITELINSGVLGKVFTFFGKYGFPPISHDNIRYQKELGGGILNDAGCYPICASRMIFRKEPIEIMCKLTTDNTTKVDTKATTFLKFSENEYSQSVVGYDLFYQSMYSLWGSEGTLELSRAYNIPSDMKASIKINTNRMNDEILINPVNHFKLMIDNFCQEIRNRNFCDFNFEDDLLKQARIMDAARKSNQESRYVKIFDE